MPSTLLTSITHYWKLDESSGNAADSVGGTTLTNTGTMTYAAGIINNGAQPASAKYLTATDPSFSEGANMTWNFWCNPSAIAIDQRALTKRVTATNDRSFAIGADGTTASKMIAAISSDGTSGNEGLATSTTGALVNTEMHMYTITFDGSQASGSRCKIYKDTVNITASDTAPATCFNSTANFFLGAGNAGAAGIFGIIDEVGTWNRTLSIAEINELWGAGRGNQYPFNGITGNFLMFMPN